MEEIFDKYLNYARDYSEQATMTIEIMSYDDAYDLATTHEPGILNRFSRGGYSLSEDGKWRCTAEYLKKEAGIELIFGEGFSMQDVVDEISWDTINSSVSSAINEIESIKSEIENFLVDARKNNLQSSDVETLIDEWIEDLRKVSLGL